MVYTESHAASPSDKNRTVITINVAGICLHFIQCNDFPNFQQCKSHDAFLEVFPGSGPPLWELVIKCYYGQKYLDQINYHGSLLFDSGGLWKLYETEDVLRYELRSPPDAARPYRVLEVAKDYKSANLCCGKVLHDTFPSITEYPLDEILVSQLLCIKNLGLEVHALGVKEGSNSFLFIGESGAGKSTMAELWKNRKTATILSDDRIILKTDGQSVTQWGTPWHGDARISTSDYATVDKIFLLKQAPKNGIKLLHPADAAVKMYVRCFPPFWHKKANINILELINTIVTTVPCYELSFRPDSSIIDFIYEI